MKISVVIPSYLGPYKTAAKNRPEKLARAVESVNYQTHKDYEILLVSHGCEETLKIARNKLHRIDKLKCFYINREDNDLWSGQPRNAGIYRANGTIICYLDIDDLFEPTHLEFIADKFEKEWIWFNDKRLVKEAYQENEVVFKENKCDIDRQYHCGTSNIAHKKYLGFWPVNNDYAHDDWNFINRLKEFDYSFVGCGGYLVHHLPAHKGFSYDI